MTFSSTREQETLEQCERALAALAELRAAIGSGPVLSRAKTKRFVEVWSEMDATYRDLRDHCQKNLRRGG